MRNLYKIIDNMLEVIPEENERLIYSLKDIQSSFAFSSPEMVSFWWNECANILNSEIPDRLENWHFKLADIFSGKKLQ